MVFHISINDFELLTT